MLENIPLKIIKTDRKKTMQITIKPDATVEVRVPKRISERKIQNYIKSKQDWLERSFKEVRERAELKPDHKFNTGEIFLFLGEKYKLEVLEHDKVDDLFFDQGFFLKKSAKDSARELMEEWYKDSALAIFEERVEKYSECDNKFEVNKVKISWATKRWGSCSGSGNLNFNWRLVMAPMEIVDYVVIHELVHLVHANHSRSFWGLVGKSCPDYKDKRVWLKENQTRLDL